MFKKCLFLNTLSLLYNINKQKSDFSYWGRHKHFQLVDILFIRFFSKFSIFLYFDPTMYHSPTQKPVRQRMIGLNKVMLVTKLEALTACRNLIHDKAKSHPCVKSHTCVKSHPSIISSLHQISSLHHISSLHQISSLRQMPFIHQISSLHQIS
jgi:hypothetical protein